MFAGRVGDPGIAADNRVVHAGCQVHLSGDCGGTRTEPGLGTDQGVAAATEIAARIVSKPGRLRAAHDAVERLGPDRRVGCARGAKQQGPRSDRSVVCPVGVAEGFAADAGVARGVAERAAGTGTEDGVAHPGREGGQGKVARAGVGRAADPGDSAENYVAAAYAQIHAIIEGEHPGPARQCVGLHGTENGIRGKDLIISVSVGEPQRLKILFQWHPGGRRLAELWRETLWRKICRSDSTHRLGHRNTQGVFSRRQERRKVVT